MPTYRRSYYGCTYFFTVVTYHRRPILASEAARNFLHTAWIDVQKRHPFTTDAICLLPDRIVQSVWEWPWSSFHRFVEQGYYSQGWGAGEDRLAQLSIGE